MLYFNKKQSGMSVTEAMVAVAILTISAAAIMGYITQSHSFSIKVEGAAECRNDVESLVSQFSDNSSTQVTNFIPFANVTGTRTLAGAPEAYDTVVAGSNPLQFRNYQNIENSVTKAFLLYRSDSANYCGTANGVQVTNANKANIFSDVAIFDKIQGQGKNVFVRIVPFNMANQNTPPLVCTDRDISPLSTANQTLQKALQIQIRINNPTTQAVCTASALLKYNIDTRAPSAAGSTLTAANCNVSASLNSNEPGSIFECSAGPNPFQLCDNAHFSASFPGYSTTLAVTNPGTGLSSTQAVAFVSGFPNNTTTLFSVRAVDTAGNRSPPVNQNVVCCVDTVWLPPANLTCSPGLVPQTSNCGNTRTVLATGPPCVPVVDCSNPGWTACTGSSCGIGAGTQSFTATPESGGGATCMALFGRNIGDTRPCDIPCGPVDCQQIPGWTPPCVGCGAGVQTYTYIAATGGGSDAICLAEAALSPKACPAVPVDCSGGAWTPCSGPCGVGNGTQTFTATPEACGGATCLAVFGQNIGATRSCDMPACSANCSGAWGACSVSCGGGTQTFSGTPESGGGLTCMAIYGVNLGDTQVCNPQACVYATCCTGMTVNLTGGGPCVGPNTYYNYGPNPSECSCACPQPEMCDVGASRVLDCSDPKWLNHAVLDINGNTLCSGFGPPVTCP